MRADAREGGKVCLRPSPTAIGPAAYGHRLHTRQDVSGLVGCVLRCRCLRRRGAGGTRGHGGRWHPADPLRAQAAVDRSGAAQGDHGDLVRRLCGMQWRAIGQLCDIPFGTLYSLFARWTRLGLWRRLLNRLILAWRQACGDTAEPSAVIIDSRSCRSAPTCFAAASMAARRSRASRSISRSINTASR